MTIKGYLLIGGSIALLTIAGCGGDSDDGPPTVRYGDSICTECGMILSDERFANATMIDGDRGNEPLLFDDFICQMNFESKHTDLTIVDRWTHDHQSSSWIKTADAWFVRSDELRTPMASHIAAFGSKEDADAFGESLNAETLSFQSLWDE